MKHQHERYSMELICSPIKAGDGLMFENANANANATADMHLVQYYNTALSKFPQAHPPALNNVMR